MALTTSPPAMAHRFYCQQPPDAAEAVLSGAEAHHLVHVMRLGIGDMVTLFDGSGDEFSARIRQIGKREVRLEVVARTEIDRELTFELVLAVALPKGERQRWLIEKAVELGVSRLVPLRTRRGVAQPVAAALARLRRAVIEASKQCGRNRLMQIDEPADWEQLVRQAPARADRLVAQPAAYATPALTALVSRTDPAAELWVAVGPEGGFGDEELAAAMAAGWQPVDLGPRTLRVETAAVALAALAAACEPLRRRTGHDAQAVP